MVMNMKKIQKIDEKINRLPGVESIGIIGDPGCDGLGTYNMKVYAGALEKAGRDDITLIVGDLVPTGTAAYYNAICHFTEAVAENPVYLLRGNHDTGQYRQHFGEHNYALLFQDFALVVLDNAMRKFEDEGLDLLEQVLDMDDVKRVIISFHIPVPNHFIKNCVSREEFDRLKKAYVRHKDKVKYLVCGHVHSRFEDKIDGIPLICTGGGGAMIEDVSEEIKAADVEHHMVHFFMDKGEIRYKFENLWENCYGREARDSILKEQIMDTVAGELMAHLRYLMHADRARRRGLDQIAELFEALAASEYYHARNFYSVIERPPVFSKAGNEFRKTEEFEAGHYYRMMQQYCKDHTYPLAEGAYKAAIEAEKQHAKLLKNLSDHKKTLSDPIYVCPICGHLMTEDKKTDRCPSCGAPEREYKKYCLT